MVEMVKKSIFFVAINRHIVGKYSPKVSMPNSSSSEDTDPETGARQVVTSRPRGRNGFLCASGAETRFSVTAESNRMLCIPLQRNTM